MSIDIYLMLGSVLNFALWEKVNKNKVVVTGYFNSGVLTMNVCSLNSWMKFFLLFFTS